jgi:RHS repeat-associated protein
MAAAPCQLDDVEDSLGSSRVVTSNTGVLCYDADFYPYGGERPYTNSCTQNNYKFEGKERDTETGNDDFGARYYSNRFGRWLSADWSNVPVPVPYANLTNPQTLNLYSMVADDPESFADLDGHQCTGTGNALAPGCNAGGASGGETAAKDADKQVAAAQNQSGLTASVVSGQKDAAGTPYAEAAAGFTVFIQSKTNFAPGDLTVTADLHFDADKKVAKGTEVLLGAAAESAQAKVGGQEAPKTVNSLLVDVRPYNKSGSFGGKPQEGGYIRFTTTDSQGHKQTGTLNVQVISKRIPGGYSLPAGAWVQRLVVPIPNP